MSLLRNVIRCLLVQQREAHVVNNKFIPKAEPACDLDIYNLKNFLLTNNRILVLTGAGVSTESGIPDYRSEGVGLYARSDNRPVQYNDFVKSESIRQRYWARNYAGWSVFSSFLPNLCHKTLRRWEITGKVHWLVTQNVDALHIKAGSIKLTELHGSAHRVMCMSCDDKMSREQLQNLIGQHNPMWQAKSVDMAPDGDVQLTTEQVQGFKVYSGFRFVNAAHTQKKPIAIVNIGPTRADNLASLKVSAKCSDVLQRLEL
ncbi:NAD-dependent protein lipoamidase sirtuin-4, mitochondrial-like isoform X2 [Mizuhopecten yessoensis]|uniref:NAD-dependent protein lipoamidase sirtuin-4, mitochondrial-like isoform X2 n=1 Tax=Mizuhopecten yessoensis TaxID=6573 RepID=UPI000B45B68B|nr:NAD-dependent protein lipoamidase sirtuin-4, mitochondrial-like isoform X2 [Mizuhopecten yessoensis]